MLFIDRQTERTKLGMFARDVCAGTPERHLALVGPRRIGKTRILEGFLAFERGPWRRDLAVAFLKIDGITSTLHTYLSRDDSRGRRRLLQKVRHQRAIAERSRFRPRRRSALARDRSGIGDPPGAGHDKGSAGWRTRRLHGGDRSARAGCRHLEPVAIVRLMGEILGQGPLMGRFDIVTIGPFGGPTWFISMSGFDERARARVSELGIHVSTDDDLQSIADVVGVRRS